MRSTGVWRYSFGTRWKWMASFTLRRFYLGERAPGTYWIGGCVAPRAGLDAVEKRNISCSCQEPNPDSWVTESVAQSLYSLSYPGFGSETVELHIARAGGVASDRGWTRHEDYYLLGCDPVQSGRYLSAFRKNLLPPSSGFQPRWNSGFHCRRQA
jgi:hypothetical protein